MQIQIKSMKKKLLLLPLIAGLFYITLSSNSSSPATTASAINGTGATGVRGCYGSACHGTTAGTSTTVTIELDSAGYAVTHYIAGRSYNITLTGVNNLPGSYLPKYGFQLTAVWLTSGTHIAGTGTASNAGTLATTGLPTGTATHSVYGTSFMLTEHTMRLTPLSGTGGIGTTYKVSIPWTAPTTAGGGKVVLYGVINAINNSGAADTGDKWNNDSLLIDELVTPVAPITGARTVCVGANITLSDATTGGTWGSLTPSIASVSTGGVTTGVTAGVAVISYHTTLAGTAYDTITVVGPPSPGNISGGSQICRTTSITLSSTASGGTWTSSAPSIVTVNPSTGVAYGVALGTATITYSVTGACGTGRTTYRDTVVNTISGGSITVPASLCPLGTGTAIRVSGSGGGTWSSSNTSVASINSSTGVIYGVTPGTVTISYSVSNACGSVLSTLPATVGPHPPAIAGPSSVCVNSAVTLSDSVTGGLWTSSNSSIAVAAAGLGTVTGAATGSATITYTTPAGCIVTTPITVNRIPSPITGTFHVCPNAITSISDTTVGGTWISADTTKAKFTGPGSVKGVASGTVTVSYALPVTGCAVTASIIVNPQPGFIVGSPAVCATSIDSLSNYTAGGTWTASPSSVATIDASGALHSVSAGTVAITYTLPTSCNVIRNITVHPLPVPVISLNWGTNTFSVANYYTSYQWFENGSLVTGASINTFSVADNGSYKVIVRDTFGCVDSSTYVVANLSVKSLTVRDDIKLSPNPASGFVNIDAPFAVKVIITSVDGKVMMERDNARTLDIGAIPYGVYMVVLYNEAGEKVSVNKLIKQ